jgi:hypothetical protein
MIFGLDVADNALARGLYVAAALNFPIRFRPLLSFGLQWITQ